MTVNRMTSVLLKQAHLVWIVSIYNIGIGFFIVGHFGRARLGGCLGRTFLYSRAGSWGVGLVAQASSAGGKLLVYEWRRRRL